MLRVPGRRAQLEDIAPPQILRASGHVIGYEIENDPNAVTSEGRDHCPEGGLSPEFGGNR